MKKKETLMKLENEDNSLVSNASVIKVKRQLCQPKILCSRTQVTYFHIRSLVIFPKDYSILIPSLNSLGHEL